jgi:hypothetical protein
MKTSKIFRRLLNPRHSADANTTVICVFANAMNAAQTIGARTAPSTDEIRIGNAMNDCCHNSTTYFMPCEQHRVERLWERVNGDGLSPQARSYCPVSVICLHDEVTREEHED